MEMVDIHTHKPGLGISIQNVSALNEMIPDRFYSMGIHPMHSDSGVDEYLCKIESAAGDGRLTAVGEAGLDRNAATSIECQSGIFKRQIALAEQFKLPLIIHCVRAFPELISLYKELRPRQAWIIHSFNNRREILQELLRHGFYISVGKQVMNEASNIFRLLPEIPLERLFLETDDSDLGIEVVYDRAAAALHIPEQELRKNVYDNFTRLFRF